MSQLVSVIIPLYNKEKYIEETIDSLIKQTHTNLEIIVIDDGSTDNSASVVSAINDSRIKLYKQLNKGPGAAQNLGFKVSSGNLIKFLDADDVLTYDAIKNQVISIINESNVISYLEWEKFNDTIPEYKQSIKTIHKDCTPIDYLTFNESPQMLQSGQFLIQREIILKSGLWRENLSLINDTEFYTRLLLNADQLKFTSKGKLYYRIVLNSKSVSQIFNKRALRSAVISVDECAKMLLNVECSERVKVLLGKMYQMILEWSYPDFISISKIIEKRQQLIPKQYWVPTKSSSSYNILLNILGWKVVWRLRKILYKYRA